MRRPRRAPRIALLTALALASCAPAPEGPRPPEAEPGQELVPPGYGTLRQDDVTVSLRSGGLLLKVTPLEEWVIRLTAPDTYRRLRELAARHRPLAVESGAGGETTLFLISLFSNEPETTFQPEDLQLVSRGRPERPLAIRGMTSGWGTRRLVAQETQMAIYVFDDVDLSFDLVVEYEDARSREWSRILRLLETERARARARAGVGP